MWFLFSWNISILSASRTRKNVDKFKFFLCLWWALPSGIWNQLSLGSSTLILSMKRLHLLIYDFLWFCSCQNCLTMHEKNILPKSLIHGTMYRQAAIFYEQLLCPERTKRVLWSLFLDTIGTFFVSLYVKILFILNWGWCMPAQFRM